ncbi:TIGR04141 family sporadically distributed protein [Glycomyces luteolus]|uniref:TIGR04141 family sporadically distributed protein n=1 Tax=Glycomyces luteolus TaxID=2670330 RepID=A0A9X3PB49_9ACTN|nr:DUF6119 family protein [Glycomyces luteolus]MDA1362163.1 TIGR04141 family sporadically distributed protein [Glycomyces luteolus]
MANPPLTHSRKATLYRLFGVEPDLDSICNAFKEKLDQLAADGGDHYRTSLAGCPALVLCGSYEGPPGWLLDAETMTGMTFPYTDHRSFVLLVIAVDRHVYALGFGTGYHFIPTGCKDLRFGLSLANRVADPDFVKNIVRRRPGQRGRIDATLSPEGLPLWSILVDKGQDIVARLGSRVDGLNLTAGRGSRKRMLVDGGTGLNTRFGTRPEDLVADIRELATILESQDPVPELAFTEQLMVVRDPELRETLDARLDAILACADSAVEEIGLAVPNECMEHHDQARAADIRIGSVLKPVEEVSIEAIVQRTEVQQPGSRVQALRAGRITLFADRDRTELLGRAAAIEWIEASASVGSRRFHLLDGAWLEMDAGFADRHDEFILDLMTDPSGIELPCWPHGWHEKPYLAHVGKRTGMTVLDTKFVYPSGGGAVEICDLLGPDDELIHVKQASGSAALSHLFKQALVSVDALRSSEVRRQFAAVVEAEGKNRTVPVDFMPRKVVLAFKHRGGRRLDVNTLFPFAKIALAETAERLQDQGIKVQVVLIDPVAA